MVLKYSTLMIYVPPTIILKFIPNQIKEARELLLYILICLVLFILYMTYQASIFILVLGQFFWILVLFCPKLYSDILYINKDKGRFIWDILSKPAYPAISNIIHCHRDDATIWSDVLVTAASVPWNTRDTLRIKKPYAYLASRIPNVPDRMIMWIICILEIIIVFIWPILTGTTSLTSRLLFQRLFCLHDYATTKGRKNHRHQKRRQKRSRKQICKKQRFLPEIHVKYFATSNKSDDNAFSFDTDGISFVIDDSTTSITYNVQKLFIGPMRPENVVVETTDWLSSKTLYIGTMRIILNNNGN